MMLLSPFVGFIIAGLWVSASKAEISLNLRNKQYLPPPIQNSPIKEEYITIQEHPPQQKFEEKNYANSIYEIFEVHNHYEPSTEVSQNSNTAEEIHIEHINAPSDFPLDDPNLDASYLSLAAGNDDNNQEIIIKHETKNVQTNSNNIPVSFSTNYHHAFPEKSSKTQNFNLGQQYQNQKFSNNKFKGSEYLPPNSQNQQYSRQPVQISHVYQSGVKSNEKYLPPIPTKSAEGSISHKPFNINEASFKGPGYLPPPQQGLKHHNFKQPTSFKGPDYLPPHQKNTGQSHHNFVSNTPFKAPDYLPPHQHGSAQSQQIFITNTPLKGYGYLAPQQQHSTVQSQQNFEQNTLFKGPDYLPPQQQHNSGQSQQNFEQNIPYKGPDYLPPHQQHAFVQPQHNLRQNTPFKGPDYLPPHQHTKSQLRTNIQYNTGEYLPPQQTNFKGPDYLPPHQINSVSHQHAVTIPHTSFKGPDYLPPQANKVQQYQHQHQVQSLPAGYDFQRPPNADQAIAQLHTLSETPQYQEVTVKSQIQVSEREKSSDIIYGSPIQAVPQQNNGYLPPGYDFAAPENSEKAINQLHSQNSQNSDNTENKDVSGQTFSAPSNELNGLQNSYKSTQTQSYNQQQTHSQEQQVSQNFQGQSYNAGQEQSLSQQINQAPLQSFKGPDYLPPTSESSSFKGPDYLPPAQSYQAPQQTQFRGPDYLPPTESTTTQAFDRYGNTRKPFDKYGLPPANTVTVSASNKPASQPQFYAPTTSYANNAFSQSYGTLTQNQYQNTPALGQQAHQSLPHNNIRQNTALVQYNSPTAITMPQKTAQGTKSTRAKIRTVQIVNPNNIKTLKVLESLDHAGVRTIQILGPSYEQPMGDHRIVKVIGAGHKQSVQTVKIYNDHQDVIHNVNVDQSESTGYLPPRHKRNFKSKSKAKRRNHS